jgi:lipoate-protein ligase A
VIDALVAEFKAHLDEEVASGEHTQEEADQKLAKATERITDMVNNGRPEGGRGPGGRGQGD